MAGSATYKQSKTVQTVLSFKVSLFRVCLSANEDFSLLINISLIKQLNKNNEAADGEWDKCVCGSCLLPHKAPVTSKDTSTRISVPPQRSWESNQQPSDH